jgi:hypothetical protein|tara:strand:+ start:58 stop:339 length:282 start_codon:yes stop_codon:yes gene_type:complete
MYKKTTNKTTTELTRTQVLLAKKLDKKSYDKVTAVFWALLNGADYGVENPWSTQFLHTAEDLYFFHKGKQEKQPNNVIPFKVIKGGKDDKTNR